MSLRSIEPTRIAAIGLTLISLSGCQQREAEQAAAPQGPSLPISINEMMVGEVDLAADVLWAVGNGDLPKNGRDWDQVRNHAYQLIVAGQAIQLPTTGTFDAEWASDPTWKTFADQLTAIGQEAVVLAEGKQTDGWWELGGRLVENCEGCHDAFKPGIPSQGVFHEQLDPDRLQSSVFD